MVDTVAPLLEYFVSPERKWLVGFRRRVRSRMICAAATNQERHVETKSVSPPDFSDPESQRVLDAVADALIAPLAIQLAREHHARWLASRVNQ